jgi:anti-sigma factor RsiW
MKYWLWLTTRLRHWFYKVEALFCHAGQPPGMIHCRQVIDLILNYLEGTLAPEERRAFEAHIAACRNCWRFLKSYRETVALGQQLRAQEIPTDVRDRLEVFLRQRLHRSS